MGFTLSLAMRQVRPVTVRSIACWGWLARLLRVSALFLAFYGHGQDVPELPRNVGAVLPTLTQVRQVIDLGMDGARKNPHPVKVRGVITLVVDSRNDWIYVQDATGGTLVVYTSVEGPLSEGAEVEVDGTADVGAFHTFIAKAAVRVVGRKAMPVPIQTPPAQLAAGADFAQWVRVRGTIRNVARSDWGIIVLGVAQNRFFLTYIRDINGPMPRNWIDAEIEIDGLNWTETDLASRPIGFRLHVPSPASIRVIQPGHDDPYLRTLVTSAELRRRTTGSDSRVRVKGLVMAVDSGLKQIFLRDEVGTMKLQVIPSLSGWYLANNSIRFASTFQEVRLPASPLPKAGDLIEAVGALWPELPFAPRLHSGEFRVIGEGDLPAPKRISVEEGRLPVSDGQRVKLQARFIDRTTVTVGTTNVIQLWLQANDEVFEARLEGVKADQLNLEEGTLVEATGVCLPVFGELRKPRGMRLLMASRSDIVPTSGPFSWITPRILKILSGTAALALAALVWIGLLQRQVTRQTAAITDSETRLRQSVTHFRTVFRSSPALMSLTRLDNGLFVAVNDAFLRATGYEESEVVGRFARDLDLYAVPEQRLEFIELLRKEGSVRDREHLVSRKDRSTFTALITGDIIEIDGAPHTLAVAIDITDRKKAEQDTLRALAAERELGELKSRFVALVSHEFRTPLGITMSAVELLRNYFDRLPTEKRAELVDDIYSATLRMSDLMEQVLLLGRVEAGKVAFKPTPVDLVNLANKLIDEGLSASHHRCPVTLTATPDVADAMADETLLRPILSNLLSNAIKYSAEGSPVRLLLTREGNEAVFTVADRGLGIPEADQPRMFEAFHRASNVEHVSGTGLGLLIVRRCVDLHQGRIAFQSTVGEGTTFIVHIPAFAAQEPA